jgi:A/G-specific adenine glycosylase
MVARHGGRVPATGEAIRSLPGVGLYTANAIRSFAFGAPTAVVDTNAARVLQRVFGIRGNWRRTRVGQRLWALAAAIIPRRRAYDFNQAIMDLGATVCVARAPRCHECPVRRICRGARL